MVKPALAAPLRVEKPVLEAARACHVAVMSEPCSHANLVLLQPQTAIRLRCRHCHLTIDEAELSGGSCPECREEHGVHRSDFEEVEVTTRSEAEAWCDDCGVRVPLD
jgi:hypothetical protein